MASKLAWQYQAIADTLNGNGYKRGTAVVAKVVKGPCLDKTPARGRRMTETLGRAGIEKPEETVDKLYDVPCRGARKGRGRCSMDHVSETVDALERDPYAIPQPIASAGCEPKACAADAPAWGRAYRIAVEEATERASIEAGDDEQLFKRALRKHLATHPKFKRWERAESDCLCAFRERHAKRGRRTETATTETKQRTAQVRREHGGEDLTGAAAHLDELTPAGRARYHRKIGNVTEARRIESEIRAKKRSRLR